MPRRRGDAPLRRFRLRPSEDGLPPRLTEADEAHALRVLRLAPGDRLLGLDGQGSEWPLTVAHADRRTLELALDGAARTEPRPGDPGSSLPHLTVLAPIPRQGEAETMADQLAQVGAARWVPLTTQRSQDPGGARVRPDRLERAAHEASKQCLRLWDLEIAEPLDLERALARGSSDAGSSFFLEAGSSDLDHVYEPRLAHEAPANRETPSMQEDPPGLRLFVGPEGGWSSEELELLRSSGAHGLGLGPLVLRTSTAAVVGASLLVRAHGASQDAPAG